MQDNAGKDDPILEYLDSHPIIDKDQAAQLKKKVNSPRPKTAVAEIDLHGMTSVQAEAALRRKFSACKEAGFRRLRIIHGQGWHSKLDEGPVLKTLVLTMLENELKDEVRSYRPGKPEEGGGGATIVEIYQRTC